MNIDNALSLDLQTLRQGYLNGDFNPSDIIREVLKRVSEGDDKTWIQVDSEESLLAQAEELTRYPAQALPLYGIPFAVKDNIDVASLPTTAACPDYRRFAEEDATVVKKLRMAGAIPIGKTNLDQFATGLVGVRSPYGIPQNPFKSDHIPGGSSSGSAVAVASGQASFALGTDTAGSGRVPACFNNLVGLKPSKGLLSCYGVVPACKSLDCVSIFALNSADAQTVLRSAEGFDVKDPYSRRSPSSLETTRRTAREGLAFGVPDPAQLRFFGDEEYQESYLQAVSRMESLGYAKVVIDFQPFIDAARLLYEGPWVAERYWAIQDIIKNSPDILYPTTRTIIEKGIDSTAVDAFDAAYKLQALKRRSESVWNDVDFLLTPTAGARYSIDQIEADPIQTNSNLGYYTNFMNLLDLSAVAVPTAFVSDGMPFGITLVAPAFQDDKLLLIADQLHQASDLPLGSSDARIFPVVKPAHFKAKRIAVCGAHMSGLPLNRQLTDRGATLEGIFKTAPEYRLCALPNTTPPKPGLTRIGPEGASIELEIWNLPQDQWASFIDGIPSPLGIGMIQLEDGASVHGFLCESWAADSGEDVSEHGGWRAYLETKSQ